ncbi:DUF3427 domain-containing protein [Microbacterium halophytorum]|uniref:DUF3427 domain-containing protein n=1 Tax=Microbacterium halophytorum TaxID=2067568 RepID=UPI001E503405|nr:DUF3427 domain-containing protein [Microbacterium halophytorum]
MGPIDYFEGDSFALDVSFGFLERTQNAPQQFHPQVVVNDGDQNVLHAIREELARCSTFTFSVAFVTPRAVAMLKQELLDFTGTGRIITSDYQSFNQPRAFEELLELTRHTRVEALVHESRAFHPKGYVFTSADSVTAMIGSSNLTETALASNHEWNLKATAARGSDLGDQLTRLVEREVEGSRPLTPEWIDAYRARYVPQAPRPQRSAEAPLGAEQGMAERIEPNAMQQDALHKLRAVRDAGKRKALIVSATGTGKTILSALDARACNPSRLLFVVHREQILDRSIEEYRRVLGGVPSDYGKFTGHVKEHDRRYVFSTVQTLSRHLDTFAPDTFDYIVIDEAHRAGAEGHLSVITHFTPKFLLGMTATPERTDDFNVFELFDYNVPYEIRLQHALEENMLSPFHYYGIADIEYDDDRTIDAKSDLSVLVTPERSRHLVDALEKYAQAGVQPRGLIFCSRIEEAQALSTALNELQFRGRRLRTIALSSNDSLEQREAQVERLEGGELDYILSVDIFNEGVDIPSINQIVMLRQTKSAIVFVQQLGRGLRKDLPSAKEYLVVIDFIGNYANNYMIPIALFGDNSLNKESLRKELVTSAERGVLPGLSSVRFDRIANERVLAAISSARLDGIRKLREAVKSMHARVGRLPLLADFVAYESTDPVVLATQKNPPHFPALVASALGHTTGLSASEDKMLAFVSREMFAAKRAHELTVLRAILKGERVDASNVSEIAGDPTPTAARSAALARVLTGEFQTAPEMEQYGGAVIVADGSRLRLSDRFHASYSTNATFRSAIDDLISTGIPLNRERYGSGHLVPGMQYSRKDACRLLGWDNNEQGVIYGYKVHQASGTCPIFVTLHKSSDVTASVAYEDELIDPSTVRWYTRSKRTLQTPEVRAIVDRTTEPHVFVKKDDAEGSDFYYFGAARPASPEQTTMPGTNGQPLDVVRMLLRLEAPIPRGLFDYFHPTIVS